MSINKYMSFLLVAFLFAGCGSDSKGKSPQPKDLDFSSITTPEAYSDMALKAIGSYRGNILSNKISSQENLDVARLKRISNMYAEAITKKEWIREDEDIKQDGNKFSKSYRWLDKRRRVAMNIIVSTAKRGTDISLEGVEFKSNLDILESIKF